MDKHIAIIGAGELGSRHLQGLSKIGRSVNISIVDPSISSLNKAKKRFQEMPPNNFVRSISYVKTLNGLKGPIDLAIISTNADIRKKVVEKMVEIVSVKYIILEKIVFQSVDHFETVLQLFKDNEILAWVNCSRRTFPFFIELQKLLLGEARLYMNVDGGNWGLASNAIHILDLFAFLTGESELSIITSGLNNNIYSSKRNGFLELGGFLKVISKRGDHLILFDEKNSERPISLQICSANYKYNIFQSEDRVLYYQKKNNWKRKEKTFTTPYQSELTHLVAEQILDSGTSKLTTLEESFLLHRPLISAFNDHLMKITGDSYSQCPIT